MNEFELESLLVRILGDPSAFIKAMEGVASIATNTASAVVGKMQQIAASVRTMGEDASKSLLGFFAAFGGAGSFDKALEKFMDFEKAMVRFRAVLASNKADVEGAIADYDKFAGAVAGVTLATKGQVRGLIEQAQQMGITGDMAKAVAKNAISLAGATGRSAEGMLRIAVMIAQGHPEFARRILGLQGIKDNTELVTKIQEKLARGWDVQKALANTLSGQIEKLKRSMAGLAIEVGELVAKGVAPFVKFVTKMIDGFMALDPAMKSTLAVSATLLGAFSALGPALKIVSPLVTMFNPMAIGMGLAAAAAVILAQKLGIMSSVGEAWEGIKSAFEAVVEWARPISAALKSLFSDTWEVLSTGAQQAWDGIKSAFRAGVALVNSLISSLGVDIDVNAIRDWIIIVIDAVADTVRNLGAIFGSVGDLILRVWDEIAGAVTPVITAISDGIGEVVDYFSSVADWGRMASVALAGLSSGFLTIVALKHMAGEVLISLAGGAVEFLAIAVSGITNAAVAAGSAIVDAASWTFDFVGKASADIGSLVGAVMGGISTLTDAVSTEIAGGVVPAIETATESVSAWGNDTVTTADMVVFSLSAVAGVIAAIVVGIKLQALAVAALNFVYTTLRIQQIAVAIATTAWASVLVTVKGVVVLFTATLAVAKAVWAAFQVISLANIGTMIASIGTWTMWIITVGVAKAVVWLYTMAKIGLTAAVIAAKAAFWALVAVMTVSNVLMGVTMVVSAFALAGAIMGAWEAVKIFIDVLPGLTGAAAGPVAALRTVFGELVENIQLAIRAIKAGDMGLAWQILVLTAKIAVEQLKDLWPPLWEFIKTGFVAVWEYVSFVLTIKMKEGIAQMMTDFIDKLGKINFLTAAVAKKMKEKMAEGSAAVSESVKKAADTLTGTLGKAAADFKFNPNSDNVKALREELAKLIPKLEEAEAKTAWRDSWFNTDSWGAFKQEISEDTLNVGNGIGDNLAKGIAKGTKDGFQAALRYSAEGLGRISHYVDILNGKAADAGAAARGAMGGIGGGAGGVGAGVGAGGGVIAGAAGGGVASGTAVRIANPPPANQEQRDTVMLLRQIRDVLVQDAQDRGITLTVAGL